jgi:DNA-directed RNA polymerase specialized sigma24 family protein
VLLHERRWYRRFHARFSLSGEDVVSPSTEPSPSCLVEQKVLAQALARALGRMSEKYRAVVVLHDLEELEIAEISCIVGAGETTVRSRLRDGRKRLTQLLKGVPEYTARRRTT